MKAAAGERVMAVGADPSALTDPGGGADAEETGAEEESDGSDDAGDGASESGPAGESTPGG